MRLEFSGARQHARAEGLDQSEAIFSYFTDSLNESGTGLHSFGKIIYRDLWPGIDLLYEGTVDRLKYSFIVHPGADSSRIQLVYHGADLRITPEGELSVEAGAESFRDEPPKALQQINGREEIVEAGYRIFRGGAGVGYGFDVGEYDRNRDLVIDPAVLVYCGYLGGNSNDDIYGAAVDTAGNLYVVGRTASNQLSFPILIGPQTVPGGGTYDAFVAKINPSGSALLYCGFIGGSGNDEAYAIAVDGAGNAYITGQTTSASPNFPVVGPLDPTFNGRVDAFVAKVSPDGSALIYCGYIGGGGDDYGYAIAIDGQGNAYITGQTGSNPPFPLAVGPRLTPNGGQNDAFVAKINAQGSAIVYCGYIGGNGEEVGRGIAVDSEGSAYIVGTTNSAETTFPVIVGPRLTFGGRRDAFVVNVSPTGANLVYCGYIGGIEDDFGAAIAVDGAGNAYVTGAAGSNEASFPVLLGPDTTHNGGQLSILEDAFVAKIAPNGSRLIYCGYMGGSGDDYGNGIVVDEEGYAYVTGWTESRDFPAIDGPNLNHNGMRDVFLTVVSPTGAWLSSSGFIGGSSDDIAEAVALGPSGDMYVGGSTSSNTPTFPVLVGPDLTRNPNRDAFVARSSVARCRFSITPTGRHFTSAGGSGTIRVTASDESCSWRAVTIANWISFDTGGIRRGSGEIGYQVAASPTTQPRSGVIGLAGRSLRIEQTNFPLNPPPVIEMLGPTVFISGSAEQPVTVTGAGFIASTTVRWNGQALSTQFISPTELRAVVPSQQMSMSGEIMVNVVTPGPGGGVSNELYTTILPRVVGISAASYIDAGVAPESIVAGFGVGLSGALELAATVPLPTVLGDVRVEIEDALGGRRNAPLFFVSPFQLNFVLPAGTTPGSAVMFVFRGGTPVAAGLLDVRAVAPGIFTANQNGQGAPASQALRIRIDGSQNYEDLYRFDAQTQSFATDPLNLGDPGDQIFLVLYVTGVRFNSGLQHVIATVGGLNLNAIFVGPSQFVGVDQINLAALPRSLAGRGEIDLTVVVDGTASNTVRISIQ